jgi:hypothetical protein
VKLRTRLNVALMRVAGILAAAFKWTFDDVVDIGGEAILALVELVGNVLQLAFTIVVGPFLMFRKAWGLRKRITAETTWTKQRKPSTN